MSFDRLALGPYVDLYLGDSREVMESLAGDDQQVADFVLTDPPYGVDYSGRTGEKIAGDAIPQTECIRQMAGLLRADSAMLVFTRDDVQYEWRHAMEDAGLDLQGPFIWDKMRRSLAADWDHSYNRVTETILVGHKGEPPLRAWSDNGRYLPDEPGRVLCYERDDNIWHIPVPRDKRSRRHPTPKPPRLMERALLHYTDAGQTVLDPFMGSGPVGVAAVNMGRRYVGVELNRDYFNLAVENIQRAMAHRHRVEQVVSMWRSQVADVRGEGVTVS